MPAPLHKEKGEDEVHIMLGFGRGRRRRVKRGY